MLNNKKLNKGILTGLAIVALFAPTVLHNTQANASSNVNVEQDQPDASKDITFPAAPATKQEKNNHPSTHKAKKASTKDKELKETQKQLKHEKTNIKKDRKQLKKVQKQLKHAKGKPNKAELQKQLNSTEKTFAYDEQNATQDSFYIKDGGRW